MEKVEAEDPHLGLDGLGRLKFKQPVVVHEGEHVRLCLRFLNVHHLVDLENAVGDGDILAEAVRLLVVVGQVGSVCDHLKVLTLVNTDQAGRLFRDEAFKHHRHLEELTLLATKARIGLFLQCGAEAHRVRKRVQLWRQLFLLLFVFLVRCWWLERFLRFLLIFTAIDWGRQLRLVELL